ncbi:hypothetical protein BH10BAC5_BH10BAC5_24920 [soil metagenome]
MRIIYFTLILLTTAITNNAFSQSYYVTTNGNDTYSGTSISQSWRTIQKAFNSVPAGSTVYILSGTYIESNLNVNVEGTPSNYITFRNYNTDLVTIKRTDVNQVNKLVDINNKSYIRIQGLVFADLYHTLWGGAIFIERNSHHIEVINCEFKNISGNGAAIISDMQVDGNIGNLVLKNNKIHDCSPNGFFVGIMLLTGYGDSIKIKGNEIYNISSINDHSKAIMVFGRNTQYSFRYLLIDSNKIHDCLVNDGEAISTSGNVEYSTISHNRVYNINNIGIGLAGGYGVCSDPSKDVSRFITVSDNTVSKCRRQSNQSNPITATGIYLDGTNNCIVERNVVFESTQGINVSSENPISSFNNIIRDNNIYNCDRFGILIGVFDANSSSVSNCQILNNTLFKNLDSNLSVYESDFGCNRSYSCTFKNNVIYKSVRDYDNVKRLISIQSGSSGNVFDYNLYFYPRGQSSVTIDYHGTIYNSFEMYRNATGQESHSVFLNPTFVDSNILTLNLHLRSSSPGINVGDPSFIPGFNELDIDRELRVYNGRVDCGSDEVLPSGINLISNSIPEKYELFQNYPNPFNPSTNIEFSIHEVALVSLKVFDITGKEIKELVNKSLTPGKYLYQYNAELLTSGIYFYKLETGEYSETKRMILLK